MHPWLVGTSIAIISYFVSFSCFISVRTHLTISSRRGNSISWLSNINWSTKASISRRWLSGLSFFFFVTEYMN